jgi:cytochrome c-type biogenesis protein CcmE
MARKKGPSIGLILTLLVLLGGFGYLVYGGIDENLVYFLTPSELMAKGESAQGKPVRLGGMVVPGSVQWDADAIELKFRMTDNKTHLDVHSEKAPPQMFREGQGVVVEGKLNRAGVFESTSLMVKHSNEYKAPEHAEKPEDAYKTLIKTQ